MLNSVNYFIERLINIRNKVVVLPLLDKQKRVYDDCDTSYVGLPIVM
jgi:hypothetical protein